MAVSQKKGLSTEQLKTKAKAEAVKQTMKGITQAKVGEQTAAQQKAGALRGAFREAKGQGKLGLQSSLAKQLAQQTGLGSGTNKAAARQAAATAGLQGGLMMGKLGLEEAAQVGVAEQEAAGAKTEAAAQLYEQLTGEQKLDKEMAEQQRGTSIDLNNLIEDEINKTSYTFDDDEEAAVQNLINTYNSNSAEFDANPNSKQRLLTSLMGIYKDAIDSDWEDIDSGTKAFLTQNGVTEQDWNNTAELDYG
jgi:hypothetical protein